MAWTHIQSIDYTAASNTTQSMVLPSPASANSMIVGFISFTSTTMTVDGIYDDVGNSYIIQQESGSFNSLKLFGFYGVQTIPGATTCSILVSSTSNVYKIFGEFSGGKLDNASIYDTSSFTRQQQSLPSINGLTANDLVIAARSQAVNSP